jgi:hypothetical protein
VHIATSKSGFGWEKTQAFPVIARAIAGINPHAKVKILTDMQYVHAKPEFGPK